MSSSSALTTIAICQLIMTIAGFLTALALIYVLFAFKKMISNKVDEAMGKVQPVVDQAKAIAEQARQTAEMVGSKVDSIMTRAESTADKVGEKVESVTTKVDEAVSPQVATTAAVISGAIRCIQIYQDINRIRDEGLGRRE